MSKTKNGLKTGQSQKLQWKLIPTFVNQEINCEDLVFEKWHCINMKPTTKSVCNQHIVGIEEQLDEILIILNRCETVWDHFNCIKIPFLTHVSDKNMNRVYTIRIIIACAAIVMAIFNSGNAIINLMCTFIWVFMVFISILDCNYSIFVDALFTFDVYYKIINIAIGVIGNTIVNDWYKSKYPKWTDNYNIIVIYTSGTIVIIGNMLLLLFV